MVEEKYLQGGPLVQGSPQVPEVLEVPAISIDRFMRDVQRIKSLSERKKTQDITATSLENLDGHHLDIMTQS